MTGDNKLVCDLGTHTLKFGYTNTENPFKRLNALLKPKKVSAYYFSDQFSEIHDCTSLIHLRPLDKTFLTNPELEEVILTHHLFNKSTQLTTYENTHFGKPAAGRFTAVNRNEMPAFVGTESRFAVQPVMESVNTLLFNRLKFPKVLLADAKEFIVKLPTVCFSQLSSSLFSEAPEGKTCIVVDSSFCGTRLMLVVDGKSKKEWQLQTDFGGHAVTEQMLKMISHRKVDVSNDYLVVNDIKESCACVSLRFSEDLAALREALFYGDSANFCRHYLLPNKADILRGYPVAPGSGPEGDRFERLVLDCELIRPAEGLFCPSDFGFAQMGMAETLKNLVDKNFANGEIKRKLLSEIRCVGGNFNLPGVVERLAMEIRSAFNEEYTVRLLFRSETFKPELIPDWHFVGAKNRINTEDLIWFAMKEVASSKLSTQKFLNKKQCEELGEYRSREQMRLLK